MVEKKPSTGFKIFSGIFVYAVTIAVAFVAAGFIWVSYEFQKPGPLQEQVLFEVERGSASGHIATQLTATNAISNPIIFKIAARILGAQSELKAGEYELSPGMSTKDILSLIREGKTFQRNVTVREGLTSFETIRVLNAHEELQGDTLTDIPAEGTLLPETYSYASDETRSDIVLRMADAMEQLVLPACLILLEREAGTRFADMLDMECSSAPEPLKTVRDVLTLASIVEKETAVAAERNRVAGVFINRLRKNIALQTDPTVIYAITKGEHKNDGKGPLGRRLLTKDLEYDSPYNTYKYPGLPPGPIANPGRAAIEATLNPEENDFYYFVADGTGGHVFAKTLEEHNRNAAEWRKIRRAQNK